jgi:hypothetical protein
MAPRSRIDGTQLTPVLTSCGRFDLLAQTVRSFLAHFDTDRIVIAEDSGKGAEAAEFARGFPVVEMHVNQPKLGQFRSIDALYQRISTPFVLHMEDDWEFSGGVDLDRVIAFLEARPDISVVCIGYRLDPRFTHKARKEKHAGIDYIVWDVDAHPKWFSYSFNPSVGRIALWRELGSFARFVTEEEISAYCKARGMRIAMVSPAVAHHIGDNRHAHDPFQPRRATTPLAKLKRSIQKRWAKLQGSA